MAISRLTQTSLQNAFQKYNSIWDGKSAAGAMDAISSLTLASSQSVIDFNNIPQTYSHLHLRIFGVGLASGNIRLNLNYDATAANYYSHYMEGNGTAVASGSLAGSSYPYIQGPSSTNSSYPLIAIIDIFDYSNTSKNKTAKTIGGCDANGVATSYSDLMSGVWLSTAAVTAIKITHSASSFAANSTFSLYGVK